MHHGAVHHFRGQGTYWGDAVLSNHEEVSRILIQSGVRLVFTGHGHAQDITLERAGSGPGSGFLFDVETGSTVSYPNPYRIVSLSGGAARIESRFLPGIVGRPDLPSYAEARLRSDMEETAVSVLSKFGLTAEGSQRLASRFAGGVVEFSRGDEHGWDGPMDTRELDPWASVFAGPLDGLLSCLMTDLIPADNDVSLELASGSWEPAVPDQKSTSNSR
jgi:hypothetical protein